MGKVLRTVLEWQAVISLLERRLSTGFLLTAHRRRGQLGVNPDDDSPTKEAFIARLVAAWWFGLIWPLDTGKIIGGWDRFLLGRYISFFLPQQKHRITLVTGCFL